MLVSAIDLKAFILKTRPPAGLLGIYKVPILFQFSIKSWRSTVGTIGNQDNDIATIKAQGIKSHLIERRPTDKEVVSWVL